MRSSGQERPCLVAKCIYALILLVGLMTVAMGVYAVNWTPKAERSSALVRTQATQQISGVLRSGPLSR